MKEALEAVTKKDRTGASTLSKLRAAVKRDTERSNFLAATLVDFNCGDMRKLLMLLEACEKMEVIA